MPTFTPEQYAAAADWLERKHVPFTGAHRAGDRKGLLKIVAMLRQAGGSEPALFEGAVPDDGAGLFVESVVRRWNELMDGTPIPKVQVKRVPVLLRNKIRSRAKEHGNTLWVFERVFQFLRHDPWHCGENDRKWVASLRYAVRNEDKFADLLERSLTVKRDYTSGDDAAEIAPGCARIVPDVGTRCCARTAGFRKLEGRMDPDEQAAGQRTLPHDLQAEKQVLSAIMVDNGRIDVIAQSLVADDFFRVAHQKIYTVMLAMSARRQPIDMLTLRDALAGDFDDIGGFQYINSLGDFSVGWKHIEAHAAIVKRHAKRRSMIQLGARLQGQGYDGVEDVQGAIQQLGDDVYRLAHSRDASGLVRIGEAIPGFYRSMEVHHDGDGIVGIRTGLPTLDELLRGLKPGQFILFAGRPSHGKSALALQVAIHAALEQRKVVAYFSLEMSQDELFLRLVSGESGVPSERIMSRQMGEVEYEKVTEALARIDAAPLHIDDSSVRSTFEIRAKARHLQVSVGLDLIVVDYIQLIPGDRVYKGNKNLEIGEISRALKLIAKDLNVPVIALSQLNRDVDKRKDKTPVLSDLRESGSLEQDADIVLFLFRPDLYKATEDNRGTATLKVAKVRNGPIGSRRVLWVGDQTRFKESEVLQ